MSKLLAVWGSPNSGKTSFSVKLANAIYEKYITTVIVVFADPETPMMNVICGEKYDGLKSIGEILCKPQITRADVIRYILTSKKRENYGVMGYKSGDNTNTYPLYTEIQANELIEVLLMLCDVLIVDCTSGRHDNLSKVALRRANEVFTLSTPDLKSFSFLDSQGPLMKADYGSTEKQEIRIINANTETRNKMANDAKQLVPELKYVIPYSKELEKQFEEGNLFKPLSDKKTRKVFMEIATKEVAESGKAS